MGIERIAKLHSVMSQMQYIKTFCTIINKWKYSELLIFFWKCGLDSKTDQTVLMLVVAFSFASLGIMCS